MFKNNKEVFIILVSLLKTVTNSLHVVSARIKSNSYKRRNEKLDRASCIMMQSGTVRVSLSPHLLS